MANLFTKSFKLHLKLFSALIGFVALSCGVAFALFVFTRAPEKEADTALREPASLYADDSIEDLEREGQRSFGGYRLKGRPDFPLFAFADEERDLIAPQEILRKTGINGQRARRMVFNQDLFLNLARSPERRLELPLFRDLHLSVLLASPSVYGSNHGLFQGRIETDPNARVQFAVNSGRLHATIETKSYRLTILDSGRAPLRAGTLHYVVQEDLAKPFTR